jgi:uncharacterized protein (TIGR03086 family)
MSNEPLDIRVLNARAVRYSVELVRQATDDDLKRPTPCEGWDLSDLLAHMTAQHRGFASAASGSGEDLERWRVRPIVSRDGAVADYQYTADVVEAAFSPDAALERDWVLPEFGVDPADPPAFPGRIAMGFHFIDYIVHGWDVAKTLGIPYEPDPAILDRALEITLRVPVGEARTKEGAAFKPVIDGPADDTPTLDRILQFLGRSPRWPEAG